MECFDIRHGSLRQDFSVALVPVLELALVDQAVLELIEICLPLPPECGIKGECHHCIALLQSFRCWDYLCKTLHPARSF